MRWDTLLTVAFVTIAATACTTAPSTPGGVGWRVNPNYTPPTHAYLLLHGPANEIAEVIEQSRTFGWSPVEYAVLPSGSAFALMAGPEAVEPNDRMWGLILPRAIIVGPGLTPQERSVNR
jgi:hypothetical protein